MSVRAKNKRLMAYVAGFVLSLGFTLTAYFLVVGHLLPVRVLILAIIWLALAQFVAQLLLFLRLDQESRPRWNISVFGAMVGIVAILVFGTLWIMTSLNYHQMSSTKDAQEIIKDEGIRR